MEEDLPGNCNIVDTRFGCDLWFGVYLDAVAYMQ